MSTNVSVLQGRLTKDVEIRYTTGSNPTAVCNFTLAVNRDRKSENGQNTDYIRIVVLGRQAENCERYLVKGQECTVVGRIQTRNYDDNGKTVYVTEVLAREIHFGAKPNNQGNGNNAQNGYQNNNGGYNGGGYQGDNGYNAGGGYDNNGYGYSNNLPEGFQDVPGISDDDIPF